MEYDMVYCFMKSCRSLDRGGVNLHCFYLHIIDDVKIKTSLFNIE